MNSTPLIISDSVVERARQVVAYARAHRQNIHDMSRMIGHQEAGTLVPLGEDPQRQLLIPIGYTFAYSIEQHPGGWFHHVSMASSHPTRVPRPEAVDLVLEAMGLSVRVKDAVTSWLEDMDDKRKAINVLFKFEE